ncbi:hypothetical protein [Caballeronia sp. BR00000012568055]|uniref:hypothetical protein n=1 Tax=Caballeronia sp. BR00000012568055 TaxID=2918761 RepID=UPI0023F680CD
MADDIKTEQHGTPDPLRVLAGYLERALDRATSVVLMRHEPSICTVYLGDPSGPREDLRQIAAIPSSTADAMLSGTASGSNHIPIDGQPYRFVRSFTLIDDAAAVVFSA